MSKENKGKIVLDLSGNLQYHLDIEYEYIHNCSEYGCDDEGICRCGVIVDTKLEPMSAHRAVSLAESFFQEGEGEEGNFGFALAVRYLKQLFTNADDHFEIRTCGGYYGDELDGVYAEPGAEVALQSQCDVFNSMTNSERVKLVLEMEYGKLLPEVAQYSSWKLVDLPVEQVHADKGVLARVSNAIVTTYLHFTPWYDTRGYYWRKNSHWFPGIVVIPKETGEYRVIDGFHRYLAWTKKPYGLGEQKWKKLRTNKKIKVIAPVE